MMMVKKKKQQYKVGVTVIVICLLVFVGIFFAGKSLTTISYESVKIGTVEHTKTEKPSREEKIVPSYVDTPEQVKAIYMTACVAGTPSFRDELIEIAETTEINSIVIDIKDFSGGISFDTDNPLLNDFVSDRCGAGDMRELVERLHNAGIYVIGRITVFQDPLYAVAHPDVAVQKESDRTIWDDYKGVHFIDPGAQDFWKYIVELSKESHKLGFDELNYDYIRYPSDGPMKDIYFPVSYKRADGQKKEVLRDFFEYLYEEINIKEGITTSADLFGMTTTNTDDLNIGQYLEYALSYFDYVAPMVYPSHYPKGFNGWNNPNDHIYDVVHYSMSSAFNRALAFQKATSTPSDIAERISPLQLRTWIQDFDYGGDYGATEIRAQFKASYDAGVPSWMIWSPSNKYTIGALNTE